MIGEHANQAKVATRLKYLCDRRFGGDPNEMADATKINRAVLRDVFRGKYVPDDVFAHVLKRACFVRGISSAWVRRGEGDPYLHAGGIGDYRPGEEGDDAGDRDTGESPKGETVAAKGDLDLFASLVQRVKDLEDALTRPTDHPTREEMTKCLREVAYLRVAAGEVTGKRNDLAAKLAAAEKRVNELEIGAAEAERKSGRIEAALIAQRDEIDRMKAARGSAAFADGPDARAAQPDEGDLDPGTFLTVADYLAWTRGDRPERLRAGGMDRRTVGKYLSALDAAGVAEARVKRKETHEANEYQVLAFRLLVDFLGQPGADLDVITPMRFVGFAAGRVAAGQAAAG